MNILQEIKKDCSLSKKLQIYQEFKQSWRYYEPVLSGIATGLTTQDQIVYFTRKHYSLRLTQPALTNTLKVMKFLGLVYRIKEPTDRRLDHWFISEDADKYDILIKRIDEGQLIGV